MPFLGERLGLASIAGLAVLLVGQALVLPPAGLRWGTGETLILAATGLWALETILVKRLLASIPSAVMAALRMGVGLLVLVGFVALTGKLDVIGRLDVGQWAWIALTGVLLAGYVTTWFAALERAPASVVASVLVLGAVLTGALSAASKGSLPSPTVVGGYVLIVAAAGLIVAVATLAVRRSAPNRAQRELVDAGTR